MVRAGLVPLNVAWMFVPLGKIAPDVDPVMLSTVLESEKAVPGSVVLIVTGRFTGRFMLLVSTRIADVFGRPCKNLR